MYRVTNVKHNEAEGTSVADEKKRLQQMAGQRAGYDILNVLRSAAKIKDRRGETMF